MSCNSCSNVTLPGVAGPAGAVGPQGAAGDDGLGFTGGSYDSGTGIVTFTSDDGLGFSTTDLRGANGVASPALLEAATSSTEISNTSYTTALPGASVWNVADGTLDANEDTLVLLGNVLFTQSDSVTYGLNIKFGTADIEIGYPTVAAFPDFEGRYIVKNTFSVEFTRVSNTELRVVSRITLYYGFGNVTFDYSNETFASMGDMPFEISNSSQSITGINLTTSGSSGYDIDVRLKTSSGASPCKLTDCKLYLLSK